jgi:hypothetical protein
MVSHPFKCFWFRRHFVVDIFDANLISFFVEHYDDYISAIVIYNVDIEYTHYFIGIIVDEQFR